jgi:pyruvate kinase
VKYIIPLKFVCKKGGLAEVLLEKGKSIRLVTDPAFEQSGTAEQLYVDYANITRVLKKGSRVYVDDGLISLLVQEIGFYFLLDIINYKQLKNV